MTLKERIERLQVPENAVAIWGLGQTGVVLKGGGVIVYIDPYLSGEGRRAVPILIRPDEITHADFVFHTHIHIDHLDPTTVRGIAKGIAAREIRGAAKLPSSFARVWGGRTPNYPPAR